MNRILVLKGDIGTFYPGTDMARRAVYLNYGITRHYSSDEFRLVHSVTIRMNHSYYPCINMGLLAWYADIPRRKNMFESSKTNDADKVKANVESMMHRVNNLKEIDGVCVVLCVIHNDKYGEKRENVYTHASCSYRDTVGSREQVIDRALDSIKAKFNTDSDDDY